MEWRLLTILHLKRNAGRLVQGEVAEEPIPLWSEGSTPPIRSRELHVPDKSGRYATRFESRTEAH